MEVHTLVNIKTEKGMELELIFIQENGGDKSTLENIKTIKNMVLEPFTFPMEINTLENLKMVITMDKELIPILME